MERKVTEYYDYFKERYLQAQAEIEHLMSRLDKAGRLAQEHKDAWDHSHLSWESVCEDNKELEVRLDECKTVVPAAVRYMKHDEDCPKPRGDQYCPCGMSVARWNVECLLDPLDSVAAAQGQGCDHKEWVRQDAIGIDSICRVCEQEAVKEKVTIDWVAGKARPRSVEDND